MLLAVFTFALVGCLLFMSSPAAVVWAVVAVVINSIKRQVMPVFLSPVAKRRKLLPLVAYSNAPTPVMMVVRVIRILASRFHAKPTLIQWVRGVTSVARFTPCFGGAGLAHGRFAGYAPVGHLHANDAATGALDGNFVFVGHGRDCTTSGPESKLGKGRGYGPPRPKKAK